jgi:hypothetical protein
MILAFDGASLYERGWCTMRQLGTMMIRQRKAIEPAAPLIKTDGGLDRNWSKGARHNARRAVLNKHSQHKAVEVATRHLDRVR